MNNRVYLFDTKNYFDILYKDNKKRGLVIVIPGGGYHHTSLKESMPISNAYQKYGYHTVILNYREQLDKHPIPLQEILYTIDYMKKDNLIDKDNIILIGFSAGAHMIAMACNHHKEYPIYDGLIKACILCYPVVINNKNYWHKGSFENLIGSENLDNNELLKYTNIAESMSNDFPPTFVWHTADDDSVPLENSLALVKAFKDNNIEFEYHVFPHGVHGSSLGTEESAMGEEIKINPYIQSWVEMSIKFINNIK